MFQVTDRALEKMAELRQEREAEADQGMTLLVTESQQLAVALGNPAEEDQVIEQDGEPILIVPAALHEALDDLQLDFTEAGFEIERQSAQ